jgi:hypothetical protein
MLKEGKGEEKSYELEARLVLKLKKKLMKL